MLDKREQQPSGEKVIVHNAVTEGSGVSAVLLNANGDVVGISGLTIKSPDPRLRFAVSIESLQKFINDVRANPSIQASSRPNPIQKGLGLEQN